MDNNSSNPFQETTLSLFGLPLYSLRRRPDSKTVSVFGIPVYSRYTLGNHVYRRLLSFRWFEKSSFDLLQELLRVSRESVWADIFNSTICHSTWLKDKTFSPGRWAVGYPFLYVMYRVLNECKPSSILELGLGQSTRMTAQYARWKADVSHIIVEHDPRWIEFFSRDFVMPENSRIEQMNWDFIPYKKAQAVRCYQHFQDKIQGKQFDFICIDGPLSVDMRSYARIDVLRSLPECLSENFVIMLDDCNRTGVLNTVQEMEYCLHQHGIAYQKGIYSGEKDCILLCAEHMGFLASL